MIRGNMRGMDNIEAEAALIGLVRRNMIQMRRGVSGVFAPIMHGDVRYQRGDDGEHWRSINEVHLYGGGDCEDMAAALAAEYMMSGVPARVRVTRSGDRMFHAWTEVALTGNDGVTRYYKQDPAAWAGMRGGRFTL